MNKILSKGIVNIFTISLGQREKRLLGIIVQANVVILSSQSLFAEGIAKRLQQTLQSAVLRVIDPATSTAINDITDSAPSIVIFDVTDTKAASFCTQNDLLYSFPSLRLIRIDPESEQMRVLTSECHKAHQVQDLLDVIYRPLYA